jgi:hypothetical protein
MTKLLGTKPNQAPTNADLGDLAYQDGANAVIGPIAVSGGNVGIGTSSPADRLHVDGQIRVSGTNFPRVIFQRGSSALWEAGPRDTDDFFIRRGTGAGNTIIQGGNVGIGTSSPVTNLHVISTGASGKTFSNSAGVIIENNGISNGFYALQVSTGGASDAFSITNAGNVGIGTSSPSTALQVNGTVTATGWSGGGIVTESATQTLTNKTLEKAVLNDGYTEEVFAITDGTTVNLDPNNGSIQTWTLGANRTPGQANWAAGQSITLLIDDGTARTITWTTLAVVWKTDGGSAPTLNTTGFTAIILWKVGTTIYGARVGDA